MSLNILKWISSLILIFLKVITWHLHKQSCGFWCNSCKRFQHNHTITFVLLWCFLFVFVLFQFQKANLV